MIHKMNKLAYLAKFFLYALSNPKEGREAFRTKYQSMQNSSTKLYDYGSKQKNLENAIVELFPRSSVVIQDALSNTNKLQNHIADFFASIKSEKFPSKKKPYPTEYSIDDESGLFLYILCKETKPNHVIETGVAYGQSSMYILQALEENKKGSLHSIDAVFSPWQTKEMIGAVIPSNLKKNWHFNFGSAADKLNNIMTSLGSVDIFLHDSLHTYKNMMFEFETAWPYITNGGFLISDDIGDNNAFHDFCTKMKLDSIILKQKTGSYLGIIKKP